MFATLTNVNFSTADISSFILECEHIVEQIKKRTFSCPSTSLPEVANWVPDHNHLAEQGHDYLISKRFVSLGKDRVCLQELLVYGMKGIAAYYFHAMVLNHHSEDIGKFLLKGLSFMVSDGMAFSDNLYTQHKNDPSVEELLAMCMECGKVNFTTMELLDKANTETFGHPEPTKVLWAKTVKGGKEGILQIWLTFHSV